LITPNPASSSIKLSGPFSNCNIEIFDLRGCEVLRIKAVPFVDGLNIDLRLIKQGVYLMRLIDAKSGEIKATEQFIRSAE
jgi:hypothetical protein